MLGRINRNEWSDATGHLLARALDLSKHMNKHFAGALGRGPVELHQHMTLAVLKILDHTPARLENLLEKRALGYWVTLALAMACDLRARGARALGAWRTALRELDQLKRDCEELPIAGVSPVLPAAGPPSAPVRLPLSLFPGPDAHKRRRLTEEVIKAMAEVVRGKRERQESNAFQVESN